MRCLLLLETCGSDCQLLHCSAHASKLVALPLLQLLQTEDRPVVVERVTQVMEHRPVEKEYVVSSVSGGSGQWAVQRGQ